MHLRRASLSSATVSQYLASVCEYMAFCASSPTHAHTAPPDLHAYHYLDACVSSFIAFTYAQRQGRRRQTVVNVVYGLYMVLPAARGCLAMSEQALQGWIRLHPTTPHPPLTWPLVLLIASTMANNGYRHGCLAMLLGFDGLLRISELVGLKIRDVSSPVDLRRGISASPSATLITGRTCLRLALTKTGANLWCELHNPLIAYLLLIHIHDRPHDDRVFDFSLPSSNAKGAAAFRIAMASVCRALHLEHCHYTPHSLRHGGATHAVMHLGQSIETVLMRGRWASNSSARIYLQAGRAHLLQVDAPKHALSTAAQLQENNNWYQYLYPFFT